MQTSEKTENIIKKVFNVQCKYNSVTKNAKNPFYKSNYANLEHILDGLYPVLQEEKILIIQSANTENNFTNVKTRLTDVDSQEWIESTISLPIEKKLFKDSTESYITPQLGAISNAYCRRIGIMTLLCLKAEDDDGNSGSVPTDKNPAKKVSKGNVTDKTVEMQKCQNLDEVRKVYKTLKNFEWSETEADVLKQAVNKITEKFNGEVVA